MCIKYCEGGGNKLKKIIAFAAAVTASVIASAAAAQTFTYAGPPVPIADNTTQFAPITVVGVPVAEVITVTIGPGCGITHTFNGDLDIYLRAPSGALVELSTDNGGGGDNYCDAVFSDAAATSITSALAPMTGTWRPEQPLSTLSAEPANGEWRLVVTDDAGVDTGQINSWTISFAPPVAVVPTLSEWALILMAGLLALAGAGWAMRRRCLG